VLSLQVYSCSLCMFRFDMLILPLTTPDDLDLLLESNFWNSEIYM
jgi:hypothetical protein